jgi:hypothetical protein
MDPCFLIPSSELLGRRIQEFIEQGGMYARLLTAITVSVDEASRGESETPATWEG